MTFVNLDFSDVEAAVPFEPLANDTYTLTIDALAIIPSKNNTPDNPVAPNLKIQLRHEDQKHVVFDQKNLGVKSRPWVKQFLEAVYPATDIPNMSFETQAEADEWCASLIGQPVTCVVLQRWKTGPDGKPDGSGKKENFVDSYVKYSF